MEKYQLPSPLTGVITNVDNGVTFCMVESADTVTLNRESSQ